jgi:hypothetical protein
MSFDNDSFDDSDSNKNRPATKGFNKKPVKQVSESSWGDDSDFSKKTAPKQGSRNNDKVSVKK